MPFQPPYLGIAEVGGQPVGIIISGPGDAAHWRRLHGVYGGNPMVLEQHTQESTSAVLVLERPEAVCRHHWVIEAANGPLSRGVCRHCRTAKLFANSISDPESD